MFDVTNPFIKTIFKNSVRTAKKTQHFTITKINWLTLFREIIIFYSQSHTKHINTPCGQNAELLIVKVDVTSACRAYFSSTDFFELMLP
jgi:hypothetical protein